MAVAVRRDVLLAAGGYDESMRFAEDYDLWLRLARRHVLFVCTHEVTANYRGHEDAGQRATAQARARSLRVPGPPAAHIEAEDPATAERVREEMRGLWSRLMSQAWRSRDSAFFTLALELGAARAGQRAAQRRWRRARTFWPMWLAATRLWDRVPPGAQTSAACAATRTTASVIENPRPGSRHSCHCD